MHRPLKCINFINAILNILINLLVVLIINFKHWHVAFKWRNVFLSYTPLCSYLQGISCNKIKTSAANLFGCKWTQYINKLCNSPLLSQNKAKKLHQDAGWNARNRPIRNDTEFKQQIQETIKNGNKTPNWHPFCI